METQYGILIMPLPGDPVAPAATPASSPPNGLHACYQTWYDLLSNSISKLNSTMMLYIVIQECQTLLSNVSHMSDHHFALNVTQS